MNLLHILKSIVLARSKTETSDIRKFHTEELQAFCLAGKQHQLAASRIFRDFKEYLTELRVPVYVTETVKKQRPVRFRRR